jgi:clan AA aspartic protease
MGVFSVRVDIGDPHGEQFRAIDALVDTGSSYTVLPASTLRQLGVMPHTRQRFIIADGRTVESEIGRTWVRIDGRTEMTIVVFADEGTQPLLGAVTLEEFGLGIDPMARRLVPVVGYRLQKGHA